MPLQNHLELLEENVRDYNGRNAELIGFLPDLSQLMINVLQHEDTGYEYREWILKVQGYQTISEDVIPEEVHGVPGYIDDLWLCAYVINMMIDQEENLRPLEDNWTKDIPLMEVLNEIIQTGDEVLGDRAEKILDFVNIPRNSKVS